MLLRSARGERPGDQVPITADNLEALRPPPGAVDDVARHFAERGFDVNRGTVDMITITAAATRFDTEFGVQLVRADDGAYRVGPSDAVDRSELPLIELPAPIRALVAAIALEVPMTYDTVDP